MNFLKASGINVLIIPEDVCDKESINIYNYDKCIISQKVNISTVMLTRQLKPIMLKNYGFTKSK